MKHKNVLVLAPDVYLKGGIQRYVRAQILALDSDPKFEPYVVSLTPRGEGSFESCIKVNLTRKHNTKLENISLALRLLVFCIINRPNIIVCAHINITPLAYILKLISGAKLVTNVYGYELWTNVTKLKKFSISQSNCIIGDCNHILEFFKTAFSKTVQTALLFDPVDTEVFLPASEQEKKSIRERYDIPNKNIVMTVGRLERNKGHHLILKALQQSETWSYVIVGDGSLRNELEETTKDLGLTDRVLFLGRVPEADLPGLYSVDDIVALISHVAPGEGEGLPLGLIEAMSCGTFIVCGSKDGSVDAIETGGLEGLHADSVSEFAEILNGHDPIEKELASIEIREKAVNRFDIQQFVQNFKLILAKL